VSRARIFIGALSGLVGAPVFVACMADHTISAGPFLGSAWLTATAIALLIPGRWTR